MGTEVTAAPDDSETPAPKGIAVVFPGQGAQRPGMARDFYDAFAVSRRVFEEASDALGLSMSALCFEPNDQLDLTAFTQPALVTAEIAILRALACEVGFAPRWFGGHSLGEYTALCAAGVAPLAEVVKLVHLRGSLMQQAVPGGLGSMSVVGGPDAASEPVRNAIRAHGLDPANLNTADQVVVSGLVQLIVGLAPALAQAFPGKKYRVVPINVSGPFHSRMMKPIEEEFEAALRSCAARFAVDKAAAVTSNFLGGFHQGALEPLIRALTAQISGSVRWVDNMHAIKTRASQVYEIGPSSRLKAFFATLKTPVDSITSLESAVLCFPALGATAVSRGTEAHVPRQ